MSSDPKLNVLVVDDSAVVRQTMVKLLSPEADIATSVASDPVIAMEKMKRHRPDVIVLDLEMPRMDGLTFLRKVMREDPLPVIVCSGYVGDASELAIRALEAGAVDLIVKPKIGLQAFLHESAVTLVDAIRAAAQCRRPMLRGRAEPHVPGPNLAPRPLSDEARGARVIAMGASTGGTEALRDILEVLPANACGIAMVQHMPGQFTPSFAARLNDVCAIEVREAKSGDEVLPGRALLAPGDRHMRVVERAGRLFVEVLGGPLVSRHRPSVDVLFRSVAETAGQDGVGVLLTGMGGDGAAGLLEMKHAGARTIAQDEASCVVFGMPREAIRLGAASEVLPLPQIAGALAWSGSSRRQ